VLLSYRVRSPERRGFETRIAVSDDGLSFEDVWRATKDELEAESIERCAIATTNDGVRLYLSYVARADRRWRIASVAARDATRLDVRSRTEILTAQMTATVGVKDPVVVRVGRGWWMFVSAAVADGDSDALHDRGDAFATGGVRSATGLAVSDDGMEWEWRGIVLWPAAGAWDAYAARITSVWRQAGLYRAFYDGAAQVRENYEERTGLLESADGLSWRRVTASGPLFARGSLRYVSRLERNARNFFYFEAARDGGAHDLRVVSGETSTHEMSRIG
jgi:hypothetical protein